MYYYFKKFYKEVYVKFGLKRYLHCEKERTTNIQHIKMNPCLMYYKMIYVEFRYKQYLTGKNHQIFK